MHFSQIEKNMYKPLDNCEWDMYNKIDPQGAGRKGMKK